MLFIHTVACIAFLFAAQTHAAPWKLTHNGPAQTITISSTIHGQVVSQTLRADSKMGMYSIYAFCETDPTPHPILSITKDGTIETDHGKPHWTLEEFRDELNHGEIAAVHQSITMGAAGKRKKETVDQAKVMYFTKKADDGDWIAVKETTHSITELTKKRSLCFWKGAKTKAKQKRTVVEERQEPGDRARSAYFDEYYSDYGYDDDDMYYDQLVGELEGMQELDAFRNGFVAGYQARTRKQRDDLMQRLNH